MPTFTNSASGTAGAAASYTSTTRWAYVKVENTGAAGVLWVRTDGTAAAAADGSYSLNPGESGVFANALGLWTQAATVIPAGDDLSAHPPTVAGTPGFPGTPASPTVAGGSLYGGTANPGTSVSIFSAGTPTFTIAGTG